MPGRLRAGTICPGILSGRNLCQRKQDKTMRAYERLIKYAKVFTTSDEANASVSPSTDRQFDLAGMLVEDMKELGIEDAAVDENCYVVGHIPARRL